MAEVPEGVTPLSAWRRICLCATPPAQPGAAAAERPPALAAAGAPALEPQSHGKAKKKVIVMSCPEMGTLDPFGGYASSRVVDDATARRAPEPEPQPVVGPQQTQTEVPRPEPAPECKPVDSEHPFRSCLDRPYVQKEIRWAVQYEKKIIIVFEKEHHRPGFFDYAQAGDKYRGTEWEFILGIDAIPYQRDQFLADAMMANISAKAETADVCAAENPINPPGSWEFFLSHHQALGGDQMKTLSLLFERNKKTVWYDNGKLDKSEKAMEEGVKHCQNFVLLLLLVL